MVDLRGLMLASPGAANCDMMNGGGMTEDGCEKRLRLDGSNNLGYVWQKEGEVTRLGASKRVTKEELKHSAGWSAEATNHVSAFAGGPTV